MAKTNGGELKSTNESTLPWMAKGSKSSTRRDEKAIVRVADSDVENKDKSSSGTIANESEPGKFLGQHVAERVRRVPSKKRGMMVASPSPRKSCSRRGISEHRPEINHVWKLNPKNDSSGPDFSGIALLADAACNLSNDLAPAVDRLPAEEPVVQQQDGSTILPHAVGSTDQVGQGKTDNAAPEKSSFDLADEKGIASVGGMIIATKGASESENLAPDSGVVIKSDKSSVSEPTEKKNLRLHWDLNVSMDAWGPPCDVEDDSSEKDVKGAITNPMPPTEREPIDGSKDHLDGFVASAGQEKFSLPCGPKAEAAARNGNKFKSGYNSPLEDGELREPYLREKNKVEDEGFYSMAESNDNKMKDFGKGILAETKLGPLERKSHDALRIGEAQDRRDVEKNDVARMNDLHLKKQKRSSSSRRFVPKPFKELPSHDGIPRTRSDDNEELSMAPYKCFGRHDRSSGRGYFTGRGYFSGSGSRPPYVLEPPHPENLGMMGRFDQSGSGSGQGSQPDGYVRKRFSNGGYRGGRFRRSSNGGDRVLRGRHGDNNQFYGRMHNWMSGNRRGRGNSPVFRRSRSRSPVPWNGGDRLSHPHDGFRAEERMMESVRFPFQERFLEDQEIGFMSPPRNRMPPPRFDERRSHDSGTNRNSFRGRRFGLGQRHDAGRSLRRLNSDNSNNFIPFRRQRRFDDMEDSTGANKFKMRQQQTRRADITEDGGDDVAGSGFAKESRWV
ncbi:PREDICTED: uncharacterized protein LOC106314851 [Brassica oleracea var. oleracea]|uniref:uncharacterized protein LOC106314851 n=1 Tax=Brassica oleracea var. oleracea TaxID=109376 RepID=UPI0006A74F4D|nr:PREDICTED: uncharacterized protein LOC106314851 [Brassica oleracea var. oleracea]